MALPLLDIQHRLSRASRGPWRYSGQQVMIGHGVGSSYAVTVKKPEDGEFIASARADVEGLVREVARLRQGLQEARVGLSAVHRYASGTVAEMIEGLSAQVDDYL